MKNKKWVLTNGERVKDGHIPMSSITKLHLILLYHQKML